MLHTGMINYFIPSDGDDAEHLNIFPVRKPVNEIRLRDVKQVCIECPTKPMFLSTHYFPGLSTPGHLSL